MQRTTAFFRVFPALLLLAALARPAAAAVDRWTPLGPEGGTVLALAADPASPGTVYAGTDGGGVWKSTDGGSTWRSASEGLAAPDVFSLAVAPGAVWAGTNGGIYKSTDAGATWRRVWSESDNPLSIANWIMSLAVDPADPDIVWAGSERGRILKTTDGGEFWQLSLEYFGRVRSILVDPTNPQTVYASRRKTVDGGATWQEMDSGDLLALHPSDPRILYSGHSDLFGLWKSVDAGATWTLLPGYERTAQSLLVDPFDPDVVLAGELGVGLFRSEDGGQTWNQVTGLPFFQVPALAADPTRPGRIWLGADERGVFRSLDHGRTWRVSRRGLNASHLQAAAFDPFRPRTLYVAANNLGFHRSDDGGRTWSRINQRLPATGGYGVNAQTIAAHPSRPGTLFAGTERGVYRSLDRGTHWSFVSAADPGDSNSIAFVPGRPDTIFSGGDRLLRSRDGGRTWRRIPLPATEYEPEIAKVVIAPQRPQTVFVLDFNQRNGNPQSLFRSPDGGGTWRLVLDQAPVDLAPDPTTPGLLYAATAFENAIWRSADDGITWKKIADGVGGGAELTEILVDRLDPSILYLGTFGTGVWRSNDGGVTWEPLAAGLFAPRITCLEADPRNPRRLVACTWGGGLLEIQLSSAP
jgi:photosystem II stability/assembly factor-like uncharacterized protein